MMAEHPPVPDHPVLADGVIRLRPWSMDDAPVVQIAVQDPEIPRFMGIPPQQTLEGTERWLGSLPEAWLKGDTFAFAIVDALRPRILGSVAVERSADDPAVGELGYWVAAEERRRGVATRAVRLVVSWAFGVLGFARLEITTHVDNVGSQRVAEGAGFQREGVLRGYREHQGARVDLVMFSRLPTD